MVVPNCHAIRLEMDGRRVTRIHTNRGAIEVTDNARVFLAMGTIENTRMVLNTFPEHPFAGRNLMAHLRSNVTIRVSRAAFGAALDPAAHPELRELSVGALFVKGVHKHPDGTRGHFHVQITASGVGDRERNSEVELFKKIPDLDTIEQFANNTDQWIVITLRGIGEMVGMVGSPTNAEPRNGITLHDVRGDYDYEARRASVSLEASATDLALWQAMDDACDALARIFAGAAASPTTLQYLSHPNAPARGAWQSTPPERDARRDTLSSTHHEGGTLWMGAEGKAVTDDLGRLHCTDNLYAVGPCLLPTMGSPNPMLSGVALIRRLVDKTVPAPAAQPLEPGFRSLFDGTEATFKQWKMAGRGNFTLTDGALVADPGDDLGLAYFPQAFSDFKLRLQFRVHSAEDNSGVFVRFRNPQLPVPRRAGSGADQYANGAYVGRDTGFEVQIDERGRGNAPDADGLAKHRTGALYDIPTTGGWILQEFHAAPALVPGEWNDCEVEVKQAAQGDEYVVKLNGQMTSRYVNTDGYRGRAALQDPESGYIGLQAHTGPVEFRNVRIQA
jgi:hypothetical protein